MRLRGTQCWRKRFHFPYLCVLGLLDILSWYLMSFLCLFACVHRERAERERQESLQMQQEVTYNTARILEQQQQFQNVERDVKQIEEIFKDLSMLVQEQGIQIGMMLF